MEQKPDINQFVEHIRDASTDDGPIGAFPQEWTQAAIQAAWYWAASPEHLSKELGGSPEEIIAMAFGTSWGEGLLVGLCYARDFGLPDFIKNIPVYSNSQP